MTHRVAPDLGYFVKVRSAAATGPVAPHAPGITVGDFIPLHEGTGPGMQRVLAVLMIVGGIIGGAAVAGLLWLFLGIFSLWGSPPTAADLTIIAVIGFAIAATGTACGILILRLWGRSRGLWVMEGSASIAYPGFGAPLVIPRESVRVVAIDAQPFRPFRDNKRFRIHGRLPEGTFTDALEGFPRPPWEPPSEGPKTPWFLPGRPPEGAVSKRYPTPDNPQGYVVATVERESWLFSAHGSSLPVLRLGPEDVPNVAVIFDHPLPTTKPTFGYSAGQIMGKTSILFRGGRPVRGVMLRVRDPERAAAAFARWGVLRNVTADDVVEEGLRVARPLRGWRVAAYAILVFAPLVIDLVFKRLR